MPLPISYIFTTSLRKYSRHPWLVFFGILPTIILIPIIVVVTTIQNSANIYIQDTILTKLESIQTRILLDRTAGPLVTNPASTQSDTLAYTEQDINQINQLPHVDQVLTRQKLPTVFATTTDLVPDKELTLTAFNLISPQDAAIYTSHDFHYTAGQPIPIIINKNVFSHSYIDMAGQSEIRIPQNQLSSGSSALTKYSPIKIDFLDQVYQSDLVGTIFTAKLGGFFNQPQVSQTNTTDSQGQVVVFKKLDARQVAQQQQEVRQAIEPYWDYDTLAAGLEQRFQIVGLVEGEGQTASFIPPKAGWQMLQDLHQLQRQARTSQPIPQRDYGRYFGGLRMSEAGDLIAFGTTLSSGSYAKAIDRLTLKPLVEQPALGASVLQIPGFIFQGQGSTDSSQINEVGNLQLNQGSLASTILNIVISDSHQRPQVLQSLAELGYDYALGTSGNTTDAILLAKASLNRIMGVVIVIMVVISLVLLQVSVWREIAQAQVKIGIYRALGFSRTHIASLYMGYALMQVLGSLLFGFILGLIAVYSLAPILRDFVANMGLLPLAQDGRLFDQPVLTLAAQDFYHIDWTLLSLYLVGLLGLSLLACLLPVLKAVKISPAEAIKSE